MAVVWDATMLSLLLHQTARIPTAPGTKVSIALARERIELLLSELAKAKETILIPTPALTEFLYVVEEAGPGYIHTIDKKASFDVAPYDEKAAIEAAEMMRKFKKEDGKTSGPGEGDWQKVKVDQQIVAIAKAEAVDCLYTADRGMANMAKRVKVPVIALWDLPMPPEEPQQKLNLVFEDDAADSPTPDASSELGPPSEPSPAAHPETASQLAPAPPSAPHVAPEPPLPDSSLPVPPKPQSEK